MPKTTERCTVSVCVDCIQYLANGEVTDGDGNDITVDHAQRIDIDWSRLSLGCSCCDDEDNEGWFSYSPCGLCGSHLGGHREHATIWDS